MGVSQFYGDSTQCIHQVFLYAIVYHLQYDFLYVAGDANLPRANEHATSASFRRSTNTTGGTVANTLARDLRAPSWTFQTATRDLARAGPDTLLDATMEH